MKSSPSEAEILARQKEQTALHFGARHRRPVDWRKVGEGEQLFFTDTRKKEPVPNAPVLGKKPAK